MSLSRFSLRLYLTHLPYVYQRYVRAFWYACTATDISSEPFRSFLTQDASESPVVLAVSAVGCPIRRRMSVTILPVEPYSSMAMVLNSDGRPGYRTATILDVVGWSVEGNVYPCISVVFKLFLWIQFQGVILYYVHVPGS